MINPILDLFLTKRQLTFDDYLRLSNPQKEVLHDASLLQDSRTFIDKLHVSKHEQIVIVPDYDADGVNSGIVLRAGLSLIGLTHEPHLYCPTTHLGYGLTIASVDALLQECPTATLIITTDNGVKAFDGIAYAKSRGLRVFVTDHHLGDISEPEADVIVNPNRVTDTYPFKSISGTEVVWKLLMYYAEVYGDDNMVRLMNALGVFAGISVVSDVMQVVDENRFVLTASLSMCRNTPLLIHMMDHTPHTAYQEAFRGLVVLLRMLDDNGKLKYGLDEDTFGFYISPMLNSPRRMYGTSKEAFDVFTSPDLETALKRAQELFDLNEERKQIVKVVNQAIDTHVESLPGLFCPVVTVNARMGFAGLVAGHITSTYDQPHITFAKAYDVDTLILDGDALQEQGGVIHGSGRSPAWFDLFSAVETIQKQAPHIFASFGGHAQAVGLGIYAEYYALFEHLFGSVVADAIAQKATLDVAGDDMGVSQLINPMHISISGSAPLDADLTIGEGFSLHDLCEGLALLDTMKPYGEGFRPQVFVTSVNLGNMKMRRMGAERQHAKLELPNGLVALYWNKAESLEDRNGTVLLSGTMSVNEFRGNKTPQLIIDTIVDLVG